MSETRSETVSTAVSTAGVEPVFETRPELRPYPKIPARTRSGGPGSREWTAAEKVHGAHFAVVCEGGSVRAAKRRELLDDEGLDGFFGVSRIWPELSVAAARFAALLGETLRETPRETSGEAPRETSRETWGSDATVTIYGELAGGRYPHPEVPASPGVEPVQTGVWYAPGLRWLPFDATVETPEGRWWIADRTLRTVARAAGLTCVPLLGRGPLTVLHDLPVRYPSRVPTLFGLPELPGNLAEGYVLKPAGEWRESAAARPLVKVKQQAFAEDDRYDGARPYLPPPEGAAGVPAWLLVQASALLTPARAAAAVSKLGPRTPAEAVAAEIAQDVAEELAEALGGLEASVLAALHSALEPGALALAAFDTEDRRST
ncbi:RNA ligase family protein [Kitasatospora brasiliensis]|uniref:RNA ligase family protein n=1 Tax=Kitasatospora brasiliensis TaxID=3058040 RepID=UPI002931CC9A|nr:RNA ligase family protein [Kitasatospora sp. K002]